MKDRNKLFLIDEELGFSTDYITSSYNSGSLILDSIYGENNYSKSINSNSNYFYFQNFRKTRVIDINGYEKFIDISLVDYPKSNYSLEVENEHIILKDSDKQLFKYNLTQDLKRKIKLYQQLNEAPAESFEYTIINEFGDFKLIINTMNGNIKNNEFTFNTIDGYILIKLH